ncbi:MAG: macro domain-containing protein, partial [Bacteroidetes bacterium]|nr:macro domain-containing protein [Bacteroidota bacterium]
LAFKKAFPDNYKIYREACQKGQFSVGDILVTQTGQLTPKFIINFPTKIHWRGWSKIEYIEVGMKELVKTIINNQIKSIAIPPLGCGNGGLKWEVVKPIIVNNLKNIEQDVNAIIYEPGFNNQTVAIKKNISLTPARAMLLLALKNYQILGYSTNLLVAQKIAYFLQRFGEPLNLQYQKGHYGPYSHRLQHLLKYLNGYYLKFKHEDVKPSTMVYLNHFEKVKEYSEKELGVEQLQRLKNVQMLIEGFESPYGLELLATVDFICQEGKIGDTDKIIDEIGTWTKRKKEIMKPYHIKVAHQRLKEYGSAFEQS